MEQITNVGSLLTESAKQTPRQIAVAHDRGKGLKVKSDPKSRYDVIDFESLERLSNQIALGLRQMGVQKGTRIALLVPPSVHFVASVFGLFKSGATMILIDPGMGRKNMIRCLSEAKPEGFVGIPLAQLARIVLRRKFPEAKYNLTIGRKWFWGGTSLAQIKNLDASQFSPNTSADDEAAIIFTTGSTGPPKGVLYHHLNFVEQVKQISNFYNIESGGADLSAFPLFALFNAGMGKTTIIPDMDATKPAEADPEKILRAIEDWDADQSFGSPALWNTVSVHCEKQKLKIPTLRRVLSAGAPVPIHVLERLQNQIHPEGKIHTPYGATESLPVASIDSHTILNETREQSNHGAGTCVGTRFPGIQWQVIRIDDGPIEKIEHVEKVPRGEIGELMVRGPVVTRQYVTRTDANALHKVIDGDTFWHRMGDVGYFDDQDRFWFCGRKAHRVETANGPMFTIPCESYFNQHPKVYRSALVGTVVADQKGKVPHIIVEPWPEHFPQNESEKETLLAELKSIAESNAKTQGIETFHVLKSLPVDIRHNAKIFREKLSLWVESKIDAN